MEADSFISCGLLVSNSVTYLGSELPLRGLFLLQARQVTRLVGSFRDPIWEGTRYENVEIESPRVTAIPNGSMQDLFYCLSKHKFIDLHWNKPQYKYIPPFSPCAYAPFSKSYHLISTCFDKFFFQRHRHDHHRQIRTEETYVQPTYNPVLGLLNSRIFLETHAHFYFLTIIVRLIDRRFNFIFIFNCTNGTTARLSVMTVDYRESGRS